MRFIKYFREAISGTELVGNHMGMNYPQQLSGDRTGVGALTSGKQQNVNTEVIFSDLTNTFYTYDDYQVLYQDYLKHNGKPLHGFTYDNLMTVLMK